MKQLPELILVDLDETIYDQRFCSQEGLKAVLTQYDKFNLNDLAELENIYFHELHKNHLMVIDKHITEDLAHFNRFKALINHCGLDYDESEILNMIDIYNEASNKNKRVIPYAIETLIALKNKNLKLCLITNGPSKNQRRKIDFCNIDQYFELILISEEVGYRKPDIRIFDLALKHFNVIAQNCLMVGDSWDSDIQGALNSKIKAIWYNRRNGKNIDSERVFEIFQIQELLDVI